MFVCALASFSNENTTQSPGVRFEQLVGALSFDLTNCFVLRIITFIIITRFVGSKFHPFTIFSLQISLKFTMFMLIKITNRVDEIVRSLKN